MLCIYGIWMLHDIGRIDGEDGWNSGVKIDWMSVGNLVEIRVKI